jgi:hypothetical protein
MYCQLKVYDWVFLVGFGCWGVLNTEEEFFGVISLLFFFDRNVYDK